MSRVTFHSPSGEAELRGSERAYAAHATNQLALGFLTSYRARERYGPLLPAGSYLHVTRDEYWDRTFRTWWTVGDEVLTLPDVGELAPWTLTLNTALVAGSDPIELLARLHGTCEIHGYVEAEHRGWLADIIEGGQHDKVLRAGAGWDDVVTLLRSRDDEPVVMSYSVTESFPNAHQADWMPPWPDGVPKRWDALTENQQQERADREEAWYELSGDEQWERGLRGLRATGAGNVDLTPDIWGVRGFGNGWSVFDLEEWLNTQPAVPAEAAR